MKRLTDYQRVTLLEVRRKGSVPTGTVRAHSASLLAKHGYLTLVSYNFPGTDYTLTSLGHVEISDTLDTLYYVRDGHGIAAYGSPTRTREARILVSAGLIAPASTAHDGTRYYHTTLAGRTLLALLTSPRSQP
jgi:hypothetical protein